MKWVEAVAVKDGKIVFVGDDNAAAEYKEEAEIIDLHGAMMLPGFIDSHCHPFFASVFLSGLCVDTSYSVEDVIVAMKSYIEEHPDAEFYYGYGYDEQLFDHKGPRKEPLDALCADKPIMLHSTSGHTAWVNSKALEVANVTKDTPDPIPGFQYYERDEDGTPTGYVVEDILVEHMLSALNVVNPPSIRASVKKIMQDYATMGVTSIYDAGLDPSFFDDPMSIYKLIREMTETGEIAQRYFGSVSFITDREEVELHTKSLIENAKKIKDYYCNDRMCFNTFKIINDGTAESYSAAMTKPYGNSGKIVAPMITGELHYHLCERAAKEGLHLHTHAIGDWAVHESLEVAEKLRKSGFDKNRITIAHADFICPEDIPLFAKYDVTISTTGVWMRGHSEAALQETKNVLGERVDWIYNFRSVIDQGGRISLGSDFPTMAESTPPLRSIQVAVTRQMYGEGQDAPVLPPAHEKFTVEECIDGYTIHAAYQLGVEDRLGSIEVGKYADFTILAKDITNISPYEIYKVPVLATISEGKEIWSNA